MIVTLKNIGTIEEASFDLDKNLIVFIGPNNTGKTYAAYCLYGLDKVNYKRDIFDSLFDVDIETLIDKGTIDINLEEVFNDRNLATIFETYSSIFRDFLPQLFGIESNFFENSFVGLSFTNGEAFKEYLRNYEFLLGSSGYGNNVSVSYNKKEKSPILNITLKKNKVENGESQEFPKKRILGDIKNSLIEYTFKPFNAIASAYFLPSERIGISVFSKDLFSRRFTKTNEILVLDEFNKKRILEIMNTEFNTYSLVIQDALNNYGEFTRGRERRMNNSIREKTAIIADELESKLLKGSISVSKDGDVFFNIDGNNIKIQASGSIIKSLASLVVYLRYFSYFGQILIIDEPEINLHPDNQRLIARILAKLSNLGIKVVVSTHSDYFIRELNNLMRLNKDHPETKSLKAKYGYDDSEILDYKKVGAYLFKDHHAKTIEVGESGMEAATIDEEINKLNNTANDIYWTLFED